jgi:hypothetical protein
VSTAAASADATAIARELRLALGEPGCAVCRVRLAAEHTYAIRLDEPPAGWAGILTRGIDQGIASAVVIKPNQVGTLTGARDTARIADAAGYATVAASRSGDTEDTTIADLVVAMGCRYIKAGAPARSERAAKYNRLLRIEEALGSEARFAGNERR